LVSFPSLVSKVRHAPVCALNALKIKLNNKKKSSLWAKIRTHGSNYLVGGFNSSEKYEFVSWDY